MTENNSQYMYNRFRFGNFDYGARRNKYNELLLNEFIPQIKDNDQVYDVGCGRGFFCRLLADEFNLRKENIYCIDLSEINIENLKNSGFRGKVGDNLSLDIESNSADRTISNGVIHHTSDPNKCLDELIRITRNDGLIFLSIYSNKIPYYRLVWLLGTPFRYLFWNVNKTIVETFIFSMINIFFIQPLSLIFFRKFMEKGEAEVLFMDQLITPYVHSFHRKDIVDEITNRNCEIIRMEYNKFCLMDAFIIKVKK